MELGHREGSSLNFLSLNPVVRKKASETLKVKNGDMKTFHPLN